MLGDDLPADELNRVDADRPALRLSVLPSEATPPIPEYRREAIVQRVHRAGGDALVRTSPRIGMRFYTGTQFPEAYRGNVFIAEHGSWNRSSKVGCRSCG